MLKNLLTHKVDAPEEHRIILPGLDIAISHEIKTVFIVDQTSGTASGLQDLEDHLKSLGYLLHAVVVVPKE